MTRRHPLPAEVYALVEQTPATVLLEGGKPGDTNEHPWTQLFTAPLRVRAAYSPAEIPALFAEIEGAVAAGHCAAGFFSYECANSFEPKAGSRAAREGQPLAWFGIYARSYAFDHATGEFVGGSPPKLARFHAQQISEAARASEATRPLEPELVAEFALTEAEYVQRIDRIHDWIRAGDIYQMNFTAPFSIEAQGSIAAHYARLRSRQPVDYGAFLHWQPGRHILSLSPELFFRVENGGARSGERRIVTKPMKGTAARGRTTREDREISEGLRGDPKNRSENVMIVDLVRNDLGRVARTGSVKVEELFAVEWHPTLWQMTSTVSAELRPEVGFHDIFRALFPCGSVTGAPKVRAMQLIAEIENTPRGVYTGAIGFFSPHQTVFNVAIRTLELKGAHGTMGAGSGVVIDSDPAQEFRECLLKAKFLSGPAHRITAPMSGNAPTIGQPEKLSLIETMLWNGSYPLLELHLDRLEDSAEYFDFFCDRAAVRTALEDHALQFADQESAADNFAGTAPRSFALMRRRVRLLMVDDEGHIQIGSEAISTSGEPNRIGRVTISSVRTDPADVMLYHKTTQRPLYSRAFEQATREGFDDMLFMNLRGEVTEGAISNVFVVNGDHWSTPPIECGLLAGVYRRHLLEMRPEIEERVLFIDDLRSADAIYLANAVRGLRRVEIDWRELSPQSEHGGSTDRI
jgi:para-aminobenzoate synthetase / 4-amino-4-deoxychorismate lyase